VLAYASKKAFALRSKRRARTEEVRRVFHLPTLTPRTSLARGPIGGLQSRPSISFEWQAARAQFDLEPGAKGFDARMPLDLYWRSWPRTALPCLLSLTPVRL